MTGNPHISAVPGGKHVLVTGAASGIGLAISRALIDAGARVVGLDLDAAALAQTSDQLGDAFVGVAGDLRDAEAIDGLIGQCWDHAGRLDCLVNCAGIYPVTPFLDLSVKEWDAVLDINLRAPFLVTQAFTKRVVAAKPIGQTIGQTIGGSIVNISSTASTLARPGIAHYGASKAGLNQLTKIAALELAPHRIRVNALAPGLIATERVMEHAKGVGRAEHQAKLDRIPIGREGRPEELVDLALYLLSDAAGYVTGSVFVVDGGVTLGIPSY